MERSEMSQLVRFGLYEVDLSAGELRRNGVKIKLQEQPFQILAMLLERAGEVVTREEICQRLWSDGTFVDFDHSLGTAIKKLRQALGDSADNPRFVETLARRGYRFIAPVDSPTVPSPASQPDVLQDVAPVSPPPKSASMVQGGRNPRWDCVSPCRSHRFLVETTATSQGCWLCSNHQRWLAKVPLLAPAAQ
jgi:DNA-binding winged helix-turn-helix (wHTH) protein